MVDRIRHNDFSESLLVQGGRVFACGQVGGANFHQDYYVRAMDARAGELLWEDQVDLGGDEYAFTLAAEGDRLVTAGTEFFSDGSFALLVRTYDTNTGELLWQDRVLDAENYNVRNAALVIHGGQVFVGGSAWDDTYTNLDFMVRSYDLDTGAFRWQDLPALGGFENTVYDLAIDGDRLFAVGEDGSDSIINGDAVIRAYNARTGDLLWEDPLDEAGGDDFFVSVAAQGGQVIACGAVTNIDGDYDFFVRAYDARAGVILWQDQVDVGDFDIANSLKVQGDRIFVAGALGSLTGNEDAVVRAYRLP